MACLGLAYNHESAGAKSGLALDQCCTSATLQPRQRWALDTITRPSSIYVMITLPLQQTCLQLCGVVQASSTSGFPVTRALHHAWHAYANCVSMLHYAFMHALDPTL